MERGELLGVIGDYEIFLREVLQKMISAGFDLRDFAQLDHICYRTVSAENYQSKKTALARVGLLLGETVVSGRPIAVFRLHEPIVFDGWRIDAIELPAPREGKEFDEGLEHVEFVILDSPAVFLQKYAGKDFDLKSADRGINPEIGLALDDRHAVKFHLLNLPTVLYLQDKLGITKV